jgi:hypothetical protein
MIEREGGLWEHKFVEAKSRDRVKRGDVRGTIEKQRSGTDKTKWKWISFERMDHFFEGRYGGSTFQGDVVPADDAIVRQFTSRVLTGELFDPLNGAIMIEGIECNRGSPGID